MRRDASARCQMVLPPCDGGGSCGAKVPKGAASSVSCKPPWRRRPRGGGSDFPDGFCCFAGRRWACSSMPSWSCSSRRPQASRMATELSKAFKRPASCSAEAELLLPRVQVDAAVRARAMAEGIPSPSRGIHSRRRPKWQVPRWQRRLPVGESSQQRWRRSRTRLRFLFSF